MKLEDEKGDFISAEQMETDKDGKFKYTFKVPENLEAGIYKLTIKANDPVNESREEKFTLTIN